MRIGYHLSSEELRPGPMLRWARRAEEAGFDVLTISDHFHPWTRRQGESPFVWAVLGGIAAVTERIEVGTAVTCPTVRTHPAIIAHAAATTAVMLPGRFFLGVGTGEALNEHILGHRWPASAVRREMLEEAVEVIRLLWQGGSKSHYGRHYTVEQATIFTLPDQPPPIVVSGFGPRSIELAGRIGDGYMNTKPDAQSVALFRSAGGEGKPCYGKLDVCIAETEAKARRIVLETWPTSALKGELAQVLPVPAHFEQAVANVTEEDVAQSMLCSQDPDDHVAALKEFADAGFDSVVVQQAGTDQQRFFEFYESAVLPRLSAVHA
jgi:coenzyme F420-dependent glucose-6-phosphate dehydrogenase